MPDNFESDSKEKPRMVPGYPELPLGRTFDYALAGFLHFIWKAGQT